jgi:sugar/nucleoside kinase (ribokinase family)
MEPGPRLFDLDTVMVDVVMKIQSLPERGGDSVASQRLVATGGGFNVMSAATRHGMPVVYAGQLGTGPFSELARRDLASEGITLPIRENATLDVGFCVVLVDQDGERTFVTAPGAEKLLEYSSLAQLDVSTGDYVFLSGYSLVYPEIGDAVSRWLAGLDDGVIVAFDPAPRVLDIPAPMLKSVLTRTDWLLCNATEARQLSGATVAESCLEVLLTTTGRRGVMIHDGAAGCVFAARGGLATRVAGLSSDATDTNGAGDIHDGVFLAELARGTAPQEAAARANVAAALSITAFGPAGCPARDVVSAHLGDLARAGFTTP